MKYINELQCILFLCIIPFIGLSQKAKKNTQEERMYGEVEWETKKFNILLSEITDKNSKFYFQKIIDKFVKGDTSISAKEIIALTIYTNSKNEFNPLKIDSLANQAYISNENKRYQDAIDICNKILAIAPNNVTGLKEISLAYNRIKKDKLSNMYFQQMSKVIMAIFEYSDGTYKKPFITSNFYEGISIYEAVFFTKPEKTALVQTIDKNRLLGGYNAYSKKYDEILIKYSDLTHYRKWVKKGAYEQEESLEDYLKK